MNVNNPIKEYYNQSIFKKSYQLSTPISVLQKRTQLDLSLKQRSFSRTYPYDKSIF